MGVTNSNATPRQDLGLAVMEYADRQNNYVASDVLPWFDTDAEKFDFPRVDREHLLAMADTQRGDTGPYSRSTMKVDWLDESTEEHGHEVPISDKVDSRLSRHFNYQLLETNRCMGVLQRRLEQDVADLLFNTTTFPAPQSTTVDASAGESWDHQDGTPIEDARTAREAIWEQTGMVANSCVISQGVFNVLQGNTSIRDWVIGQNNGVGEADIPRQTIARALGVENLHIGRARKRTSNKGVTFESDSIWSDTYALFFVQAPAVPGFITDDWEVGLGRIALWTEDSPTPWLVEQYREEKNRGDILRVRHNRKPFIMNGLAGHLLINVT